MHRLNTLQLCIIILMSTLLLTWNLTIKLIFAENKPNWSTVAERVSKSETEVVFKLKYGSACDNM